MNAPPRIPPAGDHGGDGAQIAAALGLDPDDVLDLSASLNPFAPDVPSLAARHLTSLKRYPDVTMAERIAAESLETPPARTVLTAGASQAIALVADELVSGWVDEPEFSLYARHLRRTTPQAPRWRSDPHSPSGALADIGETATVWDEAYLPLSAGVWTRARPGWALGSLTKAFACPGLRIGFVIAPDEGAAEAIRARRPAWAVGSLACALIPELFELADPPRWTRRITEARTGLTLVLRAHGWDPLPSAAPWVLVPGALGLRDTLAAEAIVVRDCSSFGMPDHVRIAVPDDQGLERLDAALQRIEGRRTGARHHGLLPRARPGKRRAKTGTEPARH